MMKKCLLLVVALSMPFLAGAAESTVVEDDAELRSSQELVSVDPDVEGALPRPPYCWDLDLAACTTLGATQRCTDGIWSDYVCTCRPWTVNNVTTRYWDCPTVR